jgi:hypothetical protein
VSDIGSMTLDEFEAYAARLEAAAKLVRQARADILGPTSVTVRNGPMPTISAEPSHIIAVAGEPFPCAACGRVRPERPGESVKNDVCETCGNRLPGGDVPSRLMNKGEERRNGVVTATVKPLTPEERAAKMAMPAFGADGLPLED